MWGAARTGNCKGGDLSVTLYALSPNVEDRSDERSVPPHAIFWRDPSAHRLIPTCLRSRMLLQRPQADQCSRSPARTCSRPGYSKHRDHHR
jgi:hypothetical protein